MEKKQIKKRNTKFAVLFMMIILIAYKAEILGNITKPFKC